MRCIGKLDSKERASILSDFLLVNGIGNQLEEISENEWEVWVHAEEELPRATQFYSDFKRNPSDKKYASAVKEADRIRAKEEKEERAYSKKTFTSEQIFEQSRRPSAAPLTIALIVISAAVYLLQDAQPILKHLLRISEFNWIPGGTLADKLDSLVEIKKGHVWRLVTPIFLHFSFIHIFFNLWWLFDLGTKIERQQNTWYLGFLVLAMAVISNLAQYLYGGSNFGGMSGVVYGLLGYVWMRSKYDPFSGYFMPPMTMGIMMTWFFLCWFDVIPSVANMAHTGGLAVGVAWGFWKAYRRQR